MNNMKVTIYKFRFQTRLLKSKKKRKSSGCMCLQMQKNELGGSCNMYGRDVRCLVLSCRSLRERDHLDDTGIDGRLILQWIFKKWNGGGMDWIDPAQKRDRWWALVNAGINFQVPRNAWNLLTS